jgi:hypothetical protein
MKFRSDIKEHQVTPQKIWMERRSFLGASAKIGLLGLAGLPLAGLGQTLNAKPTPSLAPSEPLTPLDKVTSHNNFY